MFSTVGILAVHGAEDVNLSPIASAPTLFVPPIQAQNEQAAFLIWTQYAAAGAAVQRGTREVQHSGVSVGRVARTDLVSA